MQIEAIPTKQTANKFLTDLFGIDEEHPCAARFVDVEDDEDEKPVVDTEGNIIGFVDLTRD